jgi:hypothetical protein
VFLDGLAASCGALLIVAGASKVYRGVRGAAGDTAIRRTLRMPWRWWRVAEPAVGCAECAVGAVVCARLLPVAGAAVMAGLGVSFCALLGYARVKGVPGGCGCIEWRVPVTAPVRTVSWREIARSAVVLAAGTAAAVSSARVSSARVSSAVVAVPAGVAAYGQGWFAAGLAAGAVVLVLLSLPSVWRTPVCHRPLWRPGRATLRALTQHGVYRAMAASAGPLGPLARYRKTGCSDEFWFPAADGGQQRSVVFVVRHGPPGEALAVRASVRDGLS